MYEASDTSVCGLKLIVYEAVNYSCSGMSMQRAAHIVVYLYRYINRYIFAVTHVPAACGPYCGILLSVYTSAPILWYTHIGVYIGIYLLSHTYLQRAAHIVVYFSARWLDEQRVFVHCNDLCRWRALHF